MNFFEIFKQCPYKIEKETEGFYKNIFVCHHPKAKKKYCSMNCPSLKEFNLEQMSLQKE